MAIEDKSLCGTRVPGQKAMVRMVPAWANPNHLVLGQRQVEEKSNEITAMPQRLKALELSGTVVTIDAMGCQRSIAQQIVNKKADYNLALKENQGHLREEVKDSFRRRAADSVSEEIDCGHSRVERRNHKASGKTEREIHAYLLKLLGI